ncbi:MAG TPA: hypothetical protein VFI34_10265 [Candidatus Limnocylindrales bacterium]|nr:hypothetical protein [Candidatus Limnocylindrales bacterium]
MTPLLVGAAGVFALVLGGLVLRSFGPAYRIGRLLATTPQVSVAQANAIADAGERRYVRITGRIDAEDEFEDADHRPLVYRRTRLEARQGRRWVAFEDQRQTVPFTINEGLDTIGIDVDALGDGLIVVPRESVGRAADVPDRAPEGIAADTAVRARIEQISSVEHAIVVGFPAIIESGPSSGPTAALTSGRGRPLILTVLEPDEAMRILAGGDASRTRLAAGLLGAGAILIGGALVWALITALLPAVVSLVPALGGLVPTALAASAEPSAVGGGDPRSNGQGPGLVGTPGLAILGVLAIGVIAVIATTIYVRITKPPGDRPGDTTRRR